MFWTFWFSNECSLQFIRETEHKDSNYYHSVAADVSFAPIAVLLSLDLYGFNFISFLGRFMLWFSLTMYSGLEIWRIENFRPAPVPKSSYGKFFMGDSYVILKVSE